MLLPKIGIDTRRRWSISIEARLGTKNVSMGSVSRTAEISGALLSAVLGVLLVTATILGPLVTGRIRFHMSDDALVQYVGGEIVTLIVAVGLLTSAPAWWLGRQWAPAVAVGAAGYIVYTFATVVAGQEFDRYPGNVEKAFLLYAATTAVAVSLLVTSFRMLTTSAHLAGPRHATSWLLIGIGAVVALLWLGQLAGYYRDGPTGEYETATALFWLIKYLDLGVVIPLAVVTGLLQRSPSPATDAAAVGMLGFMTWLLAALLLMAVEMLRRETPGASWILAVGVLVFLVPTVALWARWLVRDG